MLFANIIDTVAFWGCAILIICAIVGVLWIILVKVIGVTPPAWMIQILWIILACVIGVVAIGFLASLAGAQPQLWLRVRN